ncbi:hypothetical protein HMPREF9450_01912 [Alistipes indistinctus YIT 12060]|jgi:hypothetical protein|uniref:DUF4276 family protein n=1 Tax=Alistipes indistinctus YIT 12060 TaxID=742725 RepID=G5HB97_9BACT|nr:hypothetical protein HMPREF9450_01912 [Alistipes indistinctus YIT 12060]
MFNVYLVGEDAVTIEILHRVLRFCAEIKHVNINVIAEFPVRGGKIKDAIISYNKLSLTFPVILLTDLDDASCAPCLLKKLMKGTTPNREFVINIAVDEAEAWLMADRVGFANYFCVDIDAIPMPFPTKQGGRNYCTEMNFGIKSSYDFTHRILQTCSNSTIKNQLLPRKGAAKGPEYNPVVIPFVSSKWDINAARQNSNSLDRMINRILLLLS